MNSETSSSGINVSDSLPGPSSRDYEFLYLPFEAAEGILQPTIDADKERAFFPKRMVVGDVNESQSYAEKVCATPEQSLQVPEDEFDIIPVYDEWISFLLERRDLEEISLSFYFETLEKATNNWKELVDDLPKYVVDFEPFSGEGSKDATNKSRYPNGILLWRHCELSEAEDGGQEPLFYRSCTYADPFFQYLSSVDPDNQEFQAKYLVRQIVETALCSVVIVDERVSRTVAEKNLAEKLAGMGIWVVGKIEFLEEGGSVPVQDGVDDSEDGLVVGEEPDRQNGLVTLVIEKQEDGITTSISGSDSEDFPDLPTKIEIMTVHQTILDDGMSSTLKRLFSGSEEWREELVFGMKPQVLFPYFHSGRGHPRGLLPQNASFLEYSLLQTYILNRPSKFFFVQIALSSKEER